jgi:uncharacterized protein YndB with AHSA1/START domain
MHMPVRIEKTIDLKVPVARAWHGLTEPAELSAWFGARFDGPFVPGQSAQGIVYHPGYEGLKAEIKILAKDEPRLFSFSWSPYPIDQNRDYSGEIPTVVEFHLEPIATWTRLTVTETGFDAIPIDRVAEAYEGNLQGWDEVLGKIAKHLAG